MQSKISFILLFFSFFNCISAQTYVPGNIYLDATGYVEYRAGNLPIIISAPHGGSLEPSIIPDRNCTGCSYSKDSWTKTIAEGMYDAFIDQTGCYPHVIINLLHRKKFDANRDIGDAADGNTTVEQSWNNYHAFIDAAKTQVESDFGRGLFLDIHGHAHTIQRIELGYLLSASELALSDASLNTNTYIEESSIRTLEGDNIQGHNHAELLRDQHSFGTLLDDKGFPCVPSTNDPFPNNGEPYFSGGYNTVRHGSRDNNGNIDAIQIELNQDVRFISANRAKLIDSLTYVANEYYNYHYNNQYAGNYCSLLPVELISFTAKNEHDNIKLEWSTASEINNDYFEIQRSQNGILFELIGKVLGNGTSTEIINYHFIDDTTKEGLNYYRLKQLDYDGNFEYSDVISITFNKQLDIIQLFPNPSKGETVNLSFISNSEKDVHIDIFDSMGRLVNQLSFDVENGYNLQQLDFNLFNKGIYFIEIKSGETLYYKKLILE